MSAPLVALFVILGLALGLFLRALRSEPAPPRRRRPSRPNDRLDDVDHMVLWGEVNHDEFYRM